MKNNTSLNDSLYFTNLFSLSHYPLWVVFRLFNTSIGAGSYFINKNGLNRCENLDLLGYAGYFYCMLILNNEEKELVEKIEIYLDSKDSSECELVKQRFECLNSLGIAISQYPSVREAQKLRGIYRSEEQLLEALCSFATTSHLLHIPTRVVASKSYLVAKFQAFSLLHILVNDNPDFYKPLRNVILSIIHTLMAEEVYFSCLEDPGFSKDLKINIAYDLISLWESGSDPRLVRYLPTLDALWTARDSSPPAFGTMNCTSELLRITIDLGLEWHEFLVSHMAVEETRWALEEFLFGLSYEEINSVRSRLQKFGINAVGHEEIHSYLGSQPAYGIINSSEYRAVYNFYVDRRDAAFFRKRVSVPGPSRTLEEIYIKYRIAHG